MNLEFIDQLISSFIVIKIAFLVFVLFHTIFLFVVYNQVNSMNKVISQGSASSILRLIVLFTIIFSISLFFIAIVIL